MKKPVIDTVLIAAITFLLALGANRAMELWVLRLAFPETFALDDVYWEDFSFKLRPPARFEDRIVLVNIGDGGRRQIAEQIMQVSKYGPRVIGVDVFFNCEEGRDTVHCPQLLDTLGNRMLAEAIREAGNVVMVSSLQQTRAAAMRGVEDDYDSLEQSDFAFTQYAYTGFGNITLHGNFRESSDGSLPIGEAREIMPTASINGKVELCFAAQIARLYDSAAAKRFLDRERSSEWISFRGSVTPYHYELGSRTIRKPAYLRSIDIDSLAQGLYGHEVFRDKIVLIGFLGDYLNDPAFGSRFYTPLNPTFAGRSMPDMLGLPILANVISMILNEDYINEMSAFFTWVITLVALLINIQFLIWLFRKQSVWYDSLCFIVPVFQIVFYSWLRMELLASFNFRMEFEGIIYLVAFVSFAVNLYFGPLALLKAKLKGKRAIEEQPAP